MNGMIREIKGRFSISILSGLLLIAVGHPIKAQDTSVLTPDAFIAQIRKYHPVVKQANLITDNASAELLSARGGFDPVFDLSNSQKSLDGVNYYNYTNPELMLPTPVGVRLKAGFENSTGQFINPEQSTGVTSYLGLELPVLNGLLLDKRRAILQQAKIYLQQSEQERQLMINDLLFDAYTTYWQWAGAYQLFRVYNSYLEVADKRTRLVSLSFRNGDRAAADTVEAFAQLQNYQLLQADALMQLNDKALDLSLYLWTAGGKPYLLPSNYSPDTNQFTASLPFPDTSNLAAEVAMNHPLLRTSQFKLQDLEVERRLKFQNLLPVVNLQANLLSKEYFSYKALSVNYLENNYKFGVNMRIPLLFRQGRGEYKSIKIKIKDANLELTDKIWQLQTKIRQYYNEAFLLLNQIQTARAMLGNYTSLLKTEELKFSQGESSLFLINSRENKTLEMQQKIIELQAKYKKAVYAIQWAGGIIR